ncbi:hypothetical protein BDV41DRAFT_545593 [Aspergillus transmontanensis]|uniref:Uncharacterized protein n=1 Tax=Aspergillus transmontanensis TaxID=1034304 RepID=A0A5N6VNX6_9EURO|nr:hypothetical protein BDV41DRAFT_545593 [Aspergillus transmontanensis]
MKPIYQLRWHISVQQRKYLEFICVRAILTIYVIAGNKIFIVISVLTCQQTSPLDDYAGLFALCQGLKALLDRLGTSLVHTGPTRL